MKRGDTVVCVDGKFASRPTDPFRAEEINLPKKGKTYIVRSVVKTESGTGIRLVEIKNEKFWHDQGGLQEPIFDIRRFKLVPFRKR